MKKGYTIIIEMKKAFSESFLLILCLPLLIFSCRDQSDKFVKTLGLAGDNKFELVQV